MYKENIFFLFLHLREHGWAVGKYHRIRFDGKKYLVEIHTGNDAWFHRMGEKNINKVFEFFFTQKNNESNSYRPHGIKHKELSALNQVLLAGLEGDPSVTDLIMDVMDKGG